MRRFCVLVTVIAVLAPAFTSATVRGAASFANPQFEAQWRAGETITPNFWGPLATARDGQQESYKEAQGGTRLVQYFDKGRMELTNGTVTNGLLATDLIEGHVQVGDATFQSKDPPPIPVAGDPDGRGPTYAGLAAKGSALFRAATPYETTGAQKTVVSTRVAEDGTPTLTAPQHGSGPTAITAFDAVTKHNLPSAFAEYRDRAGVAAIGLAISEPFLATVMVGGQQREVMIQVFERRVLTYTASNPDAFKVEMGNIGQHYARWLQASGGSVGAQASTGKTANDAIRPWSAGYTVGNNYGYQDGWTNADYGDLSVAIGQMTTRYSLPSQYLQQNGIAAERAYLDHMKQIGMHDLVCFLSLPADGDERAVRPPSDMYQPIWSSPGVVNPANSWAKYVESVVKEYGDIIKVWEVWNEPDFTDDYTLSLWGGPWATRPPTAAETPNWKGTIPQYIRLLHVTYEVVHALQPDGYVATGGITSEYYLKWLLTLTENPANGAVSAQYPLTGGAYFDVLSFHQYPIYTEQDWQKGDGAFLPAGTSAADLANWTQKVKNLTFVAGQQGYNGGKYPAKILIDTETGVPWQVQTDPSTKAAVVPAAEAQRAADTARGQIAAARQLGVVQVHFYQLSDAAPDGQGLDDAFQHMGMYHYLTTPGKVQTLTAIGTAVKAVLKP